MNEVEFLSRPIGVADILSGIRYAMAFDGKDRGVSLDRRVRRCRRLMRSVVSSSGIRLRTLLCISDGERAAGIGSGGLPVGLSDYRRRD